MAPFGGWSALVRPASASPSRSTCCARRRPRRPSPRTPRRCAACCARIKAAGGEPFVADSPGGPNGPAKVARAYKHQRHRRRVRRRGRRDRLHRGRRVDLPAPERPALPHLPGRHGVPGRRRHRPGRRPQDPRADAPHRRGQAHLRLHPRPRQGPAARAAQRRDDFADMLLDLHLAVAPRFTIIDAHRRHGGPGAGQRHAHASSDSLFAARDASPSTRRSPTAPPTSAPSTRCGRRPGAASSTSTTPTRSSATRSSPTATFKPATRDMQERVPPSLRSGSAQPASPRARGSSTPDALHPLRRVRRHLRRAGDRHATRCPVYDDAALRALLRLHRGLPHGGHRQRVAAARAPLLAARRTPDADVPVATPPRPARAGVRSTVCPGLLGYPNSIL